MRRQKMYLVGAPMAAGLVIAAAVPASAQTVGYFSTPWMEEPSSTQTAPASDTNGPVKNTGASSALFNHMQNSQAPSAPSWSITPTIGIDEIATDNIEQAYSDRQRDLTSIASAGAIVTADTERFSGILAATGNYRYAINDAKTDQFSEYAYGSGRGTIFPDLLFLNFNVSIDDLSRLNSGLQNPVLQAPLDTHSFTASGSPLLYSHLGDVGFDLLRYQFGGSWFSNNSETNKGTPGNSLGPLSSSTNQSLRNDFKMAGTLFRRLLSDLTTSATQDDTANAASGNLQKANGELINEYEVTRYASIIGGAGYEWLHDSQVGAIDGRDAVWDIGGQFRPNADSSILLTYGRHDLKSDVAGEAAWQLSPFASIFAAYTDSLGTPQQSLIANSAGSLLGPDGAMTGVTFDQSTLIGTLDDPALSATPGQASTATPLGVSLADNNNFLPMENGLFRSKALRANVQDEFYENPLTLTVYHVQNISYTPLSVPSSTVEGADLSWHRQLYTGLSGMLMAGYIRTSLDRAGIANGAAGVTWSLSDSITAVLRYDYIRRSAHPADVGYYQNAITLALRKTFD